MNIFEKELSDKIIGCAFEVYNHLRSGYLEKVYERALLKEFEINSIEAVSQLPIKVLYKGLVVGDYFADIVVENKIILELKCCTNIDNSHIAQLINYLTATDIVVGYILTLEMTKNFNLKESLSKKIGTELNTDRKLATDEHR